jgi:uncharacterized protein (DUF58 family)
VAALLVAVSFLGVAVPALRTAVVALDALLAAVVAVELARTPRPSSLHVRRKTVERAGLSQDFVRSFLVEPGPAGGLVLEVREEFPATFEVRARTVDGEPAAPLADDPTGGPDHVRLPEDGRQVEIARTYRGALRGVHVLGAVRLRLLSPLGLVWRQSRLPGAQPVAIEPALAGLRHTLKLAASERWRDLGVRSLRRRGWMTDFESLRDYVPGDDPRFLDWKASARRGRPMVRQFQVERGQELILLIDCGRRMAATAASGTVRGWTKLDHALDAALQLAAVALQEGDRVGVLAFDSQVRAWVPPTRGARAFPRLVETLFDLEPSSRESDLGRALREVGIRHRRRAMVVILSDVADPLSVDRQRRALASGGRRQRILFAALDDPTVRAAAAGAEPPGEAATPLRAAAMQQMEERRSSLAHLSGVGARVLNPLPAEAAGPLLAAWLDARRAAVL